MKKPLSVVPRLAPLYAVRRAYSKAPIPQATPNLALSADQKPTSVAEYVTYALASADSDTSSTITHRLFIQ